MPVIHPTQEAYEGLEHYIGSKLFFFFFFFLFRNHLKIKKKKKYSHCVLKEPAVDFIYSVKQGKSDKYQVPFSRVFQHYLPTFNYV